jgi:polyisoprenoid-binding protein YceI
MTRMIFALVALSAGAASACAAPPQATLGAKAPDAVQVQGEVERFDIANRLAIQIDVSAGAAYTITFPGISGSFAFAPKTPEASAIDILIDTTSAQASWDVVADVAKTEFLHTAEFPQARFTSRALRKQAVDGKTAEGALTLFGDLSLHGKTLGLSVPLTLTITPCNVGVATEFAIDRRAFGAVSTSSVDAVVSDNVVVRIQGTLPRRGPKCPAVEGAATPPAAAPGPVSDAP